LTSEVIKRGDVPHLGKSGRQCHDFGQNFSTDGGRRGASLMKIMEMPAMHAHGRRAGMEAAIFAVAANAWARTIPASSCYR
jgi:hypothetical protein